MAMTAPPVSDRKRVKVYELKDNDWFDRGTGFCTGTLINDEARIHVQSEDEPERTLLETRITKDDGYQKQQDTLIVWTEQNVTDMALSFQEAEGCAAIWDFVSDSQQKLGLLVDDGLSEDIIDPSQFTLPDPDLGNLADIENTMRMANNTGAGREVLAKFILANNYISKLVPLVDMAEDFESIVDLHRLCNIMKTIILLNENDIMMTVVQDEIVLGVVGALEYDPDFPAHKANHRLWLSDKSRFKQVIKMDEPRIEQKIHQTYRLQYLKDVVLARIIDDPTFSVLNSLIYFNQIEIVSYIAATPPVLRQLFGIFKEQNTDHLRKKNAVILIQQCCTVGKGLQGPQRQNLFNQFIQNGLFNVFTYALKHTEAQVRVAGTEILIALIDHDNIFLRSQVFKAVAEKSKPLTDTLIELLLQEPDLGVKSQMADAIKVLLDPMLNGQSVDHIGRGNPDLMTKMKTSTAISHGANDFIQNFYDESSKKLFKPLKDLKSKESLHKLTTTETSLYAHLLEMLCYFLRQHAFRTKGFLLGSDLNASVARLLTSSEKFLKLGALKYFRTCLQMSDNWHHHQIMQCRALEPLLDILIQTLPKDNLLNSAALELFEFIRKGDHARDILVHLVDKFRAKIEQLSYIETFKAILVKYEQLTAPPADDLSFTTVETEQTPLRNGVTTNGQRWQGLRDIDPEEQAYFDNEDDDEALSEALSPTTTKTLSNGSSPLKPLVDYPDEDDEDVPIVNGISEDHDKENDKTAAEEAAAQTARDQTPPPERLTEKRRRQEEDDEDELAQLVSQPKRRSSIGSNASNISNSSNTSQTLRRKRSLQPKDAGPSGKKISISLAVKPENAQVQGGDS